MRTHISPLVILSLVGIACGSATESASVPGSDACTAIFDRATSRIGSVLTGANRACTKDSDCVLLIDQPACFGDACGGPVLSKTGKQSIDTALDDVGKHECREFADHGCPKRPAVPCGPPLPVACVTGTCGFR
jgi:hypothetical protein